MVKVVEAAQEIEQVISDEWYVSYPDLQRLGFGSWAERHLIRALIHLFHNHTELPEAFTFFSRMAHALTIWWQLDRRNSAREEQPDFELEYAAKDAVAAFLLDLTAEQSLKLARPFFVAIEKVPDKIAELLSSMLSYEDRRTSNSPYWELWAEITARVRAAPWLVNIDRDHANGRSLMRECFLNTEWKDGIQKWNRLEANFKRIDALFVQLPASTFVLQSYTHYLYHIGKDSLPSAFILIANKFGKGIGEAIASESNIRWYLDELLSRSMFENLASLKKDGSLRAAVMSLLDGLVSAGSSVAFQLRDDFVTPYAPN